MAVLSMKEIHSGYIGSQQAWLDFIQYFISNKHLFLQNASHSSKESLIEYMSNLEQCYVTRQVVDVDELKGMPASYRDFVCSGAASIVSHCDDLTHGETVGTTRFFVGNGLLTVGDKKVRGKDRKDHRYSYLIQDVNKKKNISEWEGDGERIYSIDKYYVYGKNQNNLYNSFSFLSNWLETVSKSYIVAEMCMGNGELIFLSPVQETADGEWEAYIYKPGDDHSVVRYRSFAELVIFEFFGVLFDFNSFEIGEDKVFDKMARMLFDLDVLRAR